MIDIILLTYFPGNPIRLPSKRQTDLLLSFSRTEYRVRGAKWKDKICQLCYLSFLANKPKNKVTP